MTSGTGLMYHVFDHFGPVVEKQLAERTAGVMISNARGTVLAYALFNLQERGRLFVAPGDIVYEGQIVGESSRDGDMVVNPLKGKKLTNIRTQSKDENVLLTPPVRMSLEQAMEYIGDDELVEVTPKNIRLRKRFLSEGERKRAERVG
jgi:GTP-binding protein